jgi:hypothetical protein
MAISSYPRVTVQGTGNANNTQNGIALMVFNPTTNKYEAATAVTFGGAQIVPLLTNILAAMTNGTQTTTICDPTTPGQKAEVNANNKLSVVI